MKILILISFVFGFYQNINAPDIIGTWNTLDDNTKIQIEDQRGVLIGRIKSSDNPKAQIGKLILKDLVKSGNKWTGKIFAVKKNGWYDVEINSNKNELNLMVQIGFVYRKLIWKK